jgi:Tol biopolymer transport system component
MRSGAIRLVVLLLVVGLGALLMFLRRSVPESEPSRLAYVATARQLGVVGYRDPAGAISPDGAWIAYTEGRMLRVRPVAGGAIAELPPGDGQLRYLAWTPDSKRVLVEDPAADRRWWTYDVDAGQRSPLWPNLDTIDGLLDGEAVSTRVDDLRQIAWSPDGESLAAVVNGREGSELWVVAGGRKARVRRVGATSGVVTFPTWVGRKDEIACLVGTRLSWPCGGAPRNLQPALDLYGPLAMSPDGARVYAGAPSTGGTLDLWSIELSTRRATRLTSFARDTYQPGIAADGTVVFKVQSYRTHVADVPAAGGPSRALATFQSETPSWDPSGHALAVTFGTWRRVIDDAKYPDIAQDIGIINLDATLPAGRPTTIVAQSPSEDQAMSWSPNRKWIALHSHREMSDDVWLRPADGSQPDRRMSMLGRGAETGWPRWSPDGRWILFNATRKSDRRGVLFFAGVDQETGAVTAEPVEIPPPGLSGDVVHAEWLPDSDRVVALTRESAGHHAIVVVARHGGPSRVVHQISSEHDFPGLGVSPDGRHVAFVAPAGDGFFQIFRLPIDGGPAVQVTTDPSNKSQPSWSPDGGRIAFTVWSYEAVFWALK